MPDEEDPWLAGRPPLRAEDLAIEECGRGVFRIPTPIPFEVGPVNAYLLRREEPVLVDCGLRSDDGWAALLAGLDRLGVRPEALRWIVATHAHIDHYGNLGRLLALAPSARAVVHEADAEGILEHEAHMIAKAPSIERRARWWGYPEEALGPARKGYMRFKGFADASVPRERALVVEGADALVDMGGTKARVVHTPGHSEGHVCLLVDDLLLAGDHILERITPNPTVYHAPVRGRKSGLHDYIESLRRVRDLPAARVLPGHGPSFAGLAARVDAILGHHEARAAKVHALLAASEAPPTILALAMRVWPTMPVHEHFLACREVEGHIDLLIEAGKARTADADADTSRPARFEQA